MCEAFRGWVRRKTSSQHAVCVRMRFQHTLVLRGHCIDWPTFLKGFFAKRNRCILLLGLLFQWCSVGCVFRSISLFAALVASRRCYFVSLVHFRLLLLHLFVCDGPLRLLTLGPLMALLPLAPSPTCFGMIEWEGKLARRFGATAVVCRRSFVLHNV
jgi:hypothetical protein